MLDVPTDQAKTYIYSFALEVTPAKNNLPSIYTVL